MSTCLKQKFKTNYLKSHNNHDDTFIISHGKCNDGLAAAHVATQFLGELTNVPFPDDHVFFLEHASNHIELFNSQGVFEKLDEASNPITLFVLDFSLQPDVLAMLYGRYPDIKVIVLDHHKSAIDMYLEKAFKETFKHVIKNNQFQFMYSTKYSGAVLAYLFFNFNNDVFEHLDWENYEELDSNTITAWVEDDEIPDWIKYIHDRDTWTWQFEYSRPFTTMFMRKVKTLGDIRKILPFDGWRITGAATDTVHKWCDQGGAICEYMVELTKEVSKDAEKASILIDGKYYYGVILNSSNCFTSDVGNLLTSNPEIDFAVMYRVTDKGEVKVGLRSHENFNCIPMAQHWHGGGHPQASGCRFSSLMDFVTQMYQPLKNGTVGVGDVALSF